MPISSKIEFLAALHPERSQPGYLITIGGAAIIFPS
jgi:hypothetical protein